MIQFTIRDLVLVTLIAALCLGWAGDRREKGARIKRLETELAFQKRLVTPDYQRGGMRDGMPLKTDY